MSKVNTDQVIFDAITAAVSRARNFDATSIEIVIDTKSFIETFNNHRDRKLCTSLNASPHLLKYLNHTSDCRYRGGHDCDCGLDEIRAGAER